MCLSQIDVCAQVLGLTELHSKRRSLCVGTVMSCIGCIFTAVVASIVSTVYLIIITVRESRAHTESYYESLSFHRYV